MTTETMTKSTAISIPDTKGLKRDLVAFVKYAASKSSTGKVWPMRITSDGFTVFGDEGIATFGKAPHAEAMSVNPYQLLEALRGMTCKAGTIHSVKGGAILRGEDGPTSLLIDGESTGLDAPFPVAPLCDPVVISRLRQRDLTEALGQLLTFTAQDRTRFAFNGVQVSEDAGRLRMVGTDGMRLGVILLQGTCRNVDLPEGSSSFPSFILPRNACALIAAIGDRLGDNAGITIRISKTQADVTLGAYSIRVNLVEGSYPDVNQVIPKARATWHLGTDYAAFLSVAKSAKVAAKESDHPVIQFALADGEVSVTGCQGASWSGSSFTIEGNARLAVNPGYLFDAISTLGTKGKPFELRGVTDPLGQVCKPLVSNGPTAHGGEWTHVLMPVTMRADGK